MTWPTNVLPEYSRNRILTVAPALLALTHIEPRYVPAEVVLIQFGESLRLHSAAPEPVFARLAAQLPEWPPETRVRVTPVPADAHPVVSVSNPGFPTRLSPAESDTVTDAVAVEDCPPVSV